MIERISAKAGPGNPPGAIAIAICLYLSALTVALRSALMVRLS
jgi:hypothetical protein